ncbi:endonuclease/exonuclease/phosphatase family protein [Candidatus Latescibacterota bacterium]
MKRPQFFHLLIVICACVLFLSDCSSIARRSHTIRIMTFNLHHCEGTDSVYDVARIARFMQDHKADIILCQEVDRGYSDRSNNENQPKILKEMLGYHSFYGPNIGEIYGNLILSRFPLLDTRNVPLPNTENKEPRGIIVSTVIVNGRSLSLLNTHLSAFSRKNRDEQVVYLQKLISELKKPVILGADFNCKPSDQLKPLLEKDNLVSTREIIHIDEAIDDILVSPGLRKKVIGGTVIPTTYSDHPAYVIDISL